MAEPHLKIVTREFKSTFPQYKPNRYVAFFELGGVASLGEGLGTSLDEAIGQLVRVYGHAMGIAVQVPGGKLDEENQEPGTETLARFAELVEERRELLATCKAAREALEVEWRVGGNGEDYPRCPACGGSGYGEKGHESDCTAKRLDEVIAKAECRPG